MCTGMDRNWTSKSEQSLEVGRNPDQRVMPNLPQLFSPTGSTENQFGSREMRVDES